MQQWFLCANMADMSLHFKDMVTKRSLVAWRFNEGEREMMRGRLSPVSAAQQKMKVYFTFAHALRAINFCKISNFVNQQEQ